MAHALYPPSRPQSVGEVLDSAFRIYSATLLRCLPYSFASVILGQLLSLYDVLHRHGNTAAALQAVQIDRLASPVWWGLLLAVIVGSTMFANAVFLRQYALASGGAAAMRDELGTGLRRAPGALLIGVIIALAFALTLIPVVLVLASIGAALGVIHSVAATSTSIGLGIGIVLAMLIAGSWVAIRWACSVPIYLLTERGPLASMSHSWRLTAGNFWRLSIIYSVGAALLLVFYLLATIAGGMVAMWLGRGDVVLWVAVSSTVIALLAALFTPFYHALILAVFGELSARREGADLAQRISAPAIQ
jgi:hypothetical protein